MTIAGLRAKAKIDYAGAAASAGLTSYNCPEEGRPFRVSPSRPQRVRAFRGGVAHRSPGDTKSPGHVDAKGETGVRAWRR